MALFKGLVSFLILVGTVIALTYMFAYFENYSRSSGFISTKRENQTTNTLEFESEKEIGDKRKTCEACSKQVPNLIIQYGVPRTATTLQFEILCLMMAFLHEDEKNSVGCFYFINPNSKYKVIKVHHISSILPSIRPGSWVFMTSKGPLTDKLRQKVIQLKQKHIDVPYIADVNLVSKRGHFIAYEYQKIFGLTDEQMKHVVEFLRYWDIIRVCCGIQMSADWRNHLAPNKTYRQHHDTNSLSYPACEMYNISSVEALLLNTRAFKTFSNISTLSNVIGKPSVVDGYLNGSYCKRCSENISKHNLKFNEKCL